MHVDGGRYPGLYSDSIPGEDTYPSSSYWDDLAWGAVWLYKATNSSSYLDQARTLWSTKLAASRSLQFDWDSKIPGVAVLLAEQVQPWSAAAPYRAAVDSVLKGWKPNGKVR
jgi:endoglucanase